MIWSPLDSASVSQGCRCVSGHWVIPPEESETDLLNQLVLTLRSSFIHHCVRLKALSVSTSVYQITYVCRRINNNHCVNVCHMVTDLKLHASNYSCACSEWIALSHYIDTEILIRLGCWTVFLSLNKHHICLEVSGLKHKFN